MSWLDPLTLQIQIDFDEASRLARRREWLGGGFLVRTIRTPEPVPVYVSPCRLERFVCPLCGGDVERREGYSKNIHLATGGSGCRRSAA